MIEDSFGNLVSIKLCGCPSPADTDTIAEKFNRTKGCQLVISPH